MTNRLNLVPGKFYWVMPVNDPDAKEAWERDKQPALFIGYDRNEERWYCLNIEGVSEWPMKWVGEEIKRS